MQAGSSFSLFHKMLQIKLLVTIKVNQNCFKMLTTVSELQQMFAKAVK